jgi:MraZ protein
MKWDTSASSRCGGALLDSYYGSYLHTLDTKGRVSIPSEMRKASGDVFVLTRGFEECLNLYPVDEWDLVDKELRDLRSTSRQARYYVRQMMASVRKVVVDGHGRITIPQWHREFAGIEGEVLVNGVLEHIEIWNPKRYEVYTEGQEETYEDVAENVWKHAKGANGTSDE